MSSDTVTVSLFDLDDQKKQEKGCWKKIACFTFFLL